MQNDKCDPKRAIDHTHRIAGQITAIERMYQDKRPCADIVQQIVAARSSLGSLAKLILSDEVSGCLPSSDKNDSIKKLLSELVDLS